MTEQKHTVSTDALATLGTIIDDSAGRDAIHLAVEPVEAGEHLNPGQDVGIRDGKAVSAKPYVGIVDPFLKDRVVRGQKFWLVVYPRTITSLRHVWEHPSFPLSEPKVEVTVVQPSTDPKEISRQWMTKWALENYGEDYYGEGKRSPEAALEYAIRSGHDLHLGPYEDAAPGTSEWWDHWETITGEKGERGGYFSCSC